jgi:hypothetical protein
MQIQQRYKNKGIKFKITSSKCFIYLQSIKSSLEKGMFLMWKERERKKILSDECISWQLFGKAKRL